MEDFPLDATRLEEYLTSLYDESVRLLDVRRLGQEEGKDLKGYGYGVPLRIDFEVGGASRSAVLETIAPGAFGHQDRADRAHSIIWGYDSFTRLPGHVRSIDLGAFRRDGRPVSLREVDEFFLLAEFIEGEEYAYDLIRLRDTDELTERDLKRADALCDYLLEIHKLQGGGAERYRRRIRELIGHEECLMAMLDAFPPDDPVIPVEWLREIELSCVRLRWRLNERTERVRQVHGDFHPWNVLFRRDADFTVLDRARGEWGEPADDVVSMTLNYLFFSLQRSGRFDGGLVRLFQRFWKRYLEGSGDEGVLQVAAPFIAFRAVVMANPVWYPNLRQEVRVGLITLVRNVLRSEEFEPQTVEQYLEGDSP